MEPPQRPGGAGDSIDMINNSSLLTDTGGTVEDRACSRERMRRRRLARSASSSSVRAPLDTPAARTACRWPTNAPRSSTAARRNSSSLSRTCRHEARLAELVSMSALTCRIVQRFVMSLRLACVNATWSHHTACGVRDTRTSTIPFVPTAATQREHASGGAPRGQRCVWREGPATPPRAPPAAVAPPAYQNHVVAMLNWAMQQCSKTWRFTQDIARKNTNSCRIKELTKQAQTRHASLMKG